MTFTLTETLLLAGGAALAALVVHGWWQARRARPLEASPLGDATPSDRRRAEPRMGAFGPDSSAFDSIGGPSSIGLSSSEGPDHGTNPGEPVLGDDADTRPAVLRVGARRNSLRLDALIDIIATLPLDAPVAGEAALAHLPTTRRAGSKPFAIEGLNAQTGEWEVPSAGAWYGEFQAGVQLANRSGPLSEIEYSEWVQKVQAFADAIGATPDFPDMLEAVSRGRELDQFASAHDAQMAFSLRAKGASWTLGYLLQVAAKQGLQAGALPGRWVLPGAGEADPPMIWLQFDPQLALAEDSASASLREASLMFDVAQTAESLEPFAALQDVARRLGRDLEAELVDEAGRPLGPHMFAAIHEQLNTLYKALASRDLAAGSVAARRLFS